CASARQRARPASCASAPGTTNACAPSSRGSTVGFFGRLFGKKGKWKTIRADYRGRPHEDWTDDEWDHFWATCSTEEYWGEWDRWSLDTYEHPQFRKVKASVLDLARQAAQASFPQEFAALLRVKGDTI